MKNHDWKESYHAIIYRHIRMTGAPTTANTEATIFGLPRLELLGDILPTISPSPTQAM